MSEILEWLKDYSPGVILLIALGAALVFRYQADRREEH
jgi:hypothetical protein